ncbi:MULTISPECIES: ATP-dependent DNA helicase RecG [unclassified Polynucleobacter]|uniref:ATP-dependent DNA helicase RecG n=1 Tax=unclassified Polynucleobacter TaxID=2640945 RepID=UPI001BFEE126|nr:MULTISPECIES: ATP-dependent DNA helicase RecG [unclassified Polynucleobacter]MBU3639669.1 ATP-dependent DNA helicase RecG [Polynucleobacter sp. AP-RePozz3-80-G7]QWD81328.1 ATP-dependent DNA helicase RecG [Polynucleobacter sp. MWH-S4W17]
MTTKQAPSTLQKMGLDSPMALALHLPSRYEDETELLTIEEAIHQGRFNSAQTQGVVIRNQVLFRPRRQMVVTIEDETETLNLRFLNFYPSQQKQMAVGVNIRVRGEVREGFQGPEMVHPTVRAVAPDTPLPASLTPVYPASVGVSQTIIRKAVSQALRDPSLQDSLAEFLPKELMAELLPSHDWPNLQEAIIYLHQPPADANTQALLERTHPAWRRVQFEELLAQQISLKRAHAIRRERHAPSFVKNKDESKGKKERQSFEAGLLKVLPFKLTNAQDRVWSEMSHDLSQSFPMNRLLQGDVGSGKTVVAALAAARAMDHGYQAAIMAPTEILAEQHYLKMKEWFEPLGVRIAWLSGSLKAKEKRLAQEVIENGQAQLIIGTHALIQENVSFAKLGLAVIDEQHRFGVRQRLEIQQRVGSELFYCHQLMMSATPIPRTLAMTYYADLDVSVIDELPPGRKPIATKVVKAGRRDEVIGGLQSWLSKDLQAYWVCPLIEESEVLQLQTAVESFEQLTQALPDFKVGLVHGRLKAEEKAAVMAAFKANEVQLLVATTVIEVGVDVPNAALMVIEHAERFGYAQIHQLRGRVGRGSADSVCILMYAEPLSMAAKERLQTLRETSDGFVIAERDLSLRGPGELLGAKQSGDAMLRFVDLQRDAWLIELAQQAAERLLAEHADLVERHLERWLGSRAEFLKA